jgi:sensory rhodopsin
MMADVTTWFAVGAIGMTVGTVLFAWEGLSGGGESKKYYATLVAISGIAAVAYGLLALEVGWQSVGDRTVFLPRYVDWLLTTPLLLLYLTMLADAGRALLGKIVAADVVVIVAGFAAALMSGVERFALFALGGLAFVYLAYLLVGPLTALVEGKRTASLFRSLRNLTVILWAIYPAIWLLGPSGLDILTLLVDAMLVTYLDLLTKVGFGLIALNASAVLAEELGEASDATPGADLATDD